MKLNINNIYPSSSSSNILKLILFNYIKHYNCYCNNHHRHYASSASSKRWLARQQRDQFSKKASMQNFRARSAYKLAELDEKFNIIKPNSINIDCGASPGSWSQYISHNNGIIIAVDLLYIDPIPGVNIIQGDFTNSITQEKIKNILKENQVDAVLSDMAPNFTGTHFELCESSFVFSEQVLKPGGTFLCKFLMGGQEMEFRKLLQTKFEKVRHEKPEASHSKSTEGYYLCLVLSNIIGQDVLENAFNFTFEEHISA
ncbi:8097_t:CDS:2, partial [Diversispora eburnea]